MTAAAEETGILGRLAAEGVVWTRARLLPAASVDNGILETPATAVDNGAGLGNGSRARLETTTGILAITDATGMAGILGTVVMTLVFGILTMLAGTAAVGKATDRGIGSVGRETAMVVRGAAADG